MMTKLFYGINDDALDISINDFIQDKKVIDINISLCSDARGLRALAVLILYEGDTK